ncbi:type II toxin-antitoxin system VapC family toxin [Actinosynnema sp. NPDC047251]|uniref:Ribonuclease VapC n=1 Tax=Saccharothrix espanaensis (strain ATCC 51144 / DSM 44229 / JCM 9112 / NBRC 15066 / NRRL 15764) TaxID=1179773 RepID=K0K1A1_SACES|nr:type II toxin-antitoxin system VapC family toxin [Saccharothrix espanaensis]CCH30363.1 hypothetical protein BN6_30560 [Saccharothrix espanaensis DSM 44229]
MNPTVVVDCSALIEVVAARTPDLGLLRRLSTSTVAAPALIDAEALGVLRRLERIEELTTEEATSAIAMVHAAPVDRVPLQPLMERAWQFRSSVHSADAFYLALAEHLNVPLITCDAKLAGSNGHQVDIEVFPVS